MALEKPENYREVPALQDGETIFAEDHNQIIADIEKIKGGKSNEVPVSNIKELKDILDGILAGKTLTASQIIFDNEEAKLIYKKYNFPKFKTNINTINLVLTDENTSSEYTAVIEKEENNYRMKSIINDFPVNKMVCLIIKSINGNDDLYYKYSVLGQFFDINKNKIYELDSNECIISDMDCPFVFNISINSSNLVLSILKSIFPTELQNKNYNIILNIKNKQLNKLDTNIYFSFIGRINTFKLQLIKTDNNKIKLIGNYTHKTSLIYPICYSPILANYFNIISNDNELINTDGITSSSGKPKKFGFMKYNNIPNTYYLKISNQDGSEIDTNEIITFDLTPDKNAEVEVKEKVIETVQDAIEALSDTYNGDFYSEPTPDNPEEEIYSFEKTTFTLEAES
ncbi:peptidase, partial [Brachyspira catarrhinii]